MNFLLLGYGKMGKLIEEIAIKKGHKIIAKVDSKNRHLLKDVDISELDVAIEFSNPKIAVDNIKWCLEANIPVVVGTTGWHDQKEEVDNYCHLKNGTYLYASNFSIGVNLFFRLNELLADMMNSQGHYSPSMLEIHHTQKLDSPSGTAISLAEGIIAKMARLNNWTDKLENSSDTIPITSQRIDPTPGTHSIVYDSDIDSIEIKHTAHSRLGFAQGTLQVAEWIIDKKGVLSMQDFLRL